MLNTRRLGAKTISKNSSDQNNSCSYFKKWLHKDFGDVDHEETVVFILSVLNGVTFDRYFAAEALK